MKLLLIAMLLLVVLLCSVCGMEIGQGSRSVRSAEEWESGVNPSPIKEWEEEGSGDVDNEYDDDSDSHSEEYDDSKESEDYGDKGDSEEYVPDEKEKPTKDEYS